AITDMNFFFSKRKNRPDGTGKASPDDEIRKRFYPIENRFPCLIINTTNGQRQVALGKSKGTGSELAL
ncbi:MAG: hypothetical protein SPL54_06355, partial [Lachnospiraceae bacterium]|nr:hypothetical protein [Lachnospiraceae bacterium]